jgi:hypothetical protein
MKKRQVEISGIVIIAIKRIASLLKFLNQFIAESAAKLINFITTLCCTGLTIIHKLKWKNNTWKNKKLNL